MLSALICNQPELLSTQKGTSAVQNRSYAFLENSEQRFCATYLFRQAQQSVFKAAAHTRSAANIGLKYANRIPSFAVHTGCSAQER